MPEAANLRRWLHSWASRAWQQVGQQEQAAWLLRPAGRELPQLRHFSSRPRGPQDLYNSVNKKVTDQGWYIVSGRGWVVPCRRCSSHLPE